MQTSAFEDISTMRWPPGTLAGEVWSWPYLKIQTVCATNGGDGNGVHWSTEGCEWAPDIKHWDFFLATILFFFVGRLFLAFLPFLNFFFLVGHFTPNFSICKQNIFTQVLWQWNESVSILLLEKHISTKTFDLVVLLGRHAKHVNNLSVPNKWHRKQHQIAFEMINKLDKNWNTKNFTLLDIGFALIWLWLCPDS